MHDERAPAAMPRRRRAGVLLHPTSLPGVDGAGDLGPAAHRFVEWLAEAGVRVWQVLPLGPTDGGGSPYSSPSSFAGNPALVSPAGLVDDGLLPAAAVTNATAPSDAADLARAARERTRLLREAWTRFRRAPREARRAFEAFLDRAAGRGRLDDWALWSALRERHRGRPWIEWPAALRDREPTALRRAFDELADVVGLERFAQFVFDRQWRALRSTAARHGVELFGDMPFYTAHESADVWADPALFRLDRERRPTHVAGVPPDYFSETGQLWGNPVYDWAAHDREGWRWWVDRLAAALERTPLLRLDHFRAFAAYWEVTAGAATAIDGRWVDGPGRRPFDAFAAARGRPFPFVAEDLGVITDDVHRLRDELGLPGTRVAQFGLLEPGSEHDPAAWPVDVAGYTGTHDNAPIGGWLDELGPEERPRALERLGGDAGGASWAAVELVWSSRAALAMAPMQDLLGLGGAARMNRPGVADGNWSWRLSAGALDRRLAGRLRALTERTGRA